MRPAEPLPLNHSWPLFERGERFGLGHVFGQTMPAVTALDDAVAEEMERAGVGFWECRLSDNALRWSPRVFEMFGLSANAQLRREQPLALYAEHSRAAMERLRSYATSHQRGFTIDVEICPTNGRSRWMRLIAAPVCDGGRAVTLHGLKYLL